MKHINLYLEYLAQEAQDEAILASMEAEAKAEAEAEFLSSMTEEEAWIYEHGVNY